MDTEFLPRRSPRLAAKAQSSTTFKAINNACNLSNVHSLGCCYMQDKRQKLVSKTKKLRDPVINIPLIVFTHEYIDGRGSNNLQKACFGRYCPSCQDYWKTRISMKK